MPRNYSIPIPSASQAAFKERDKNKTQNPGVVFDRFAPDWGNDSTLKRDALEVVLEAAGRTDRDLFIGWVARWQESARAINATPFTRISEWRFVAGLGRKGSLETGFTFNRYGFPYLPGSSVKGLARMAALVEIAEVLKTDKLNGLEDALSQDTDEAFGKVWQKHFEQTPVPPLVKTFQLVFGNTAQAGYAVFIDAIPASLPRLELDIMNPHFPDYYQGNEPPTNWQSPQPITFLTVAAGMPFQFAVGWRRGAASNPDALAQATKWLDQGLETLGAGAKTSAGYGYFVESAQNALGTGLPQPPVTPLQPPPPGYKRGTVIEFGLGPNKSYGNIKPDAGGEIVFVHRNDLADGVKTLVENQRVLYKPTSEAGKLKAKDVRPDV